MLSRLTRLTSMSSHIVGGLSHLWDDRTAPNQATAKGTHQELVGFGHDHGYYCVNSLSNSVSALTTNDDPFLGVPHRPDWNDARAEFDPLIGQIAGQPQEKIIDLRDLGGRLTPDDDLPWYEKFDITTNFLDNYSLEKTRSRNNSLNIDIGLPSAFGNNTDFSLLNECDWESPNFHSTFLNDSCLSTDPGNWPKVCETKEKGDWPKLCDQPIDDPLSEVSSQTSEYSRSTPSPLIEEEEDTKKSSEPEYTNTGRLKRQCRRLTVMDIMREACEESESGEPKRAKNVEAMTLGEYFESKDVTACLDKPKVRGVVIKPYVDAATFRRRVMNRESARKYRARKRREKYQAKSSLLDLEKRNVDLKVEVVGLEHEIAALKRQMNI